MFSCEFLEISKNTFSYRTSPVAAYENYRPVFTYFFLFSKICSMINLLHTLEMSGFLTDFQNFSRVFDPTNQARN